MQLIYVIYLFFFSFSVAFAQQWTPVSERNDISLYQRVNDAQQHEVRVETKVCTSISSFIALLHDTNFGPEWIHHAQKVELMSQSHFVDIVHTYFKPPWPARKRDMITRSMIHQDPITKQLTIIITDIGQQHPKQAGYVRMHDISGKWELTPQDDGSLLIRYTGSGKPGGKIPKWLARSLLSKSTVKTFQNLVQVIHHSKYQQAHITGILEPQGCTRTLNAKTRVMGK